MEISKIIDKSHFKTFDHVKEAVKKQLPDATDKEIREVIKTKVKDSFVNKKKIKPLMIKIFSRTPNTWFHDLLENPKNAEPKYFHLFIGTNTRYAVAYPLNSKSANAVMSTLKQFVETYKPKKLTSDQEAAFTEKSVLEYLKSHNVAIQTTSQHSTLGIIDRMILTLRNMNRPTESSKSQSHDDKYKTFTEERMKQLLEIYNNTYHSSIKTTPREMFENIELENEYINRMIDLADERKKIKDFEIPTDTFVRYILPRHDGITKKRYQYSPEKYKIAGKEGNHYILMAADGTVMNKPRFLIRVCTENENDKMKFAETIPGKWSGKIIRVIEEVGNNKVRVAFQMPNGEEYIDVIPKSYLRK